VSIPTLTTLVVVGENQQGAGGAKGANDDNNAPQQVVRLNQHLRPRHLRDYAMQIAPHINPSTPGILIGTSRRLATRFLMGCSFLKI
jgi:hypothetical protein